MAKKKIDFKPLIRLMEVLPKSGDAELTLLKSHLLLEEVLTKIISNALKNPKHMHDARLTFSQKIKLARASGEASHAVWVWKALDLLNQARNELSHNLAIEPAKAKIKKFISHVAAHSDEVPSNIFDSNFTEFHWAMLNTYLVIASIANYDPTTTREAPYS